MCVYSLDGALRDAADGDKSGRGDDVHPGAAPDCTKDSARKGLQGLPPALPVAPTPCTMVWRARWKQRRTALGAALMGLLARAIAPSGDASRHGQVIADIVRTMFNAKFVDEL